MSDQRVAIEVHGTRDDQPHREIHDLVAAADLFLGHVDQVLKSCTIQPTEGD